MGNFLFGGMVNTVIFTFATAVYLTVAATLVDLAKGGLDLPLRFALLLIVTVALWFLTMPWRRLTAMGTGAQIGHHRGALRSAYAYGRAWQGQRLDRSAKEAQVTTAEHAGNISKYTGLTAAATRETASSVDRVNLNTGALVAYAEDLAENIQRVTENTKQAAEQTKRAAESSETVAQHSETIAQGSQHAAINTQRTAEHTRRIAENTESFDEADPDDSEDEYYTRRRRGRT
jgi:methyl-accepting chemotaxis protein